MFNCLFVCFSYDGEKSRGLYEGEGRANFKMGHQYIVSADRCAVALAHHIVGNGLCGGYATYSKPANMHLPRFTML